MKVKDIIKKQTTVVAIAVILVVVATIGISYAVFFDVKKNSDNQVITAGTLKLSVSGVSALSLSEPMTTELGLVSTPVTYTVVNTDSNLPASYSIYVYQASDNAMNLGNIKISADGNASSGSTSTTISSITDTMVENGTTYYKVNSGTLAAGATSGNNYIRVWVDEENLTDEISNVNLDLNLYIVSEVQE